MDPNHLKLLQKGVEARNACRGKDPDLSEANLYGANLSGANLSRASLYGANLSEANLSGANLSRADLRVANLSEANLSEANLWGANLSRVDFSGANLWEASLDGARLIRANLSEANLSRANLNGADLTLANLSGADLSGADLWEANLSKANLSGADLSGADLWEANLSKANLSEADLSRANLMGASLLDADIRGVRLTGCRIYGISAWGLKLDKHTKQQNLIITPVNDPEITVDNIEIAQFVYLLLHNEKIRDAVDTISKKGVLLLGRFTEGRIAVLERLREELRDRDFLPIVFNFDKPETKGFTETVRLLAGMSRFVIADITNPRSAPLELQATVPECMIPFVPILEKGEEPFAMLRDLQINHRDRVFKVIRYSSVDRLVEVLDSKIVRPAQARFAQLLKRKAARIGVVDV
jgi:uncharacterized protein YjbI with pentapeptide repeats